MQAAMLPLSQISISKKKKKKKKPHHCVRNISLMMHTVAKCLYSYTNKKKKKKKTSPLRKEHFTDDAHRGEMFVFIYEYNDFDKPRKSFEYPGHFCF